MGAVHDRAAHAPGGRPPRDRDDRGHPDVGPAVRLPDPDPGPAGHPEAARAAGTEAAGLVAAGAQGRAVGRGAHAPLADRRRRGTPGRPGGHPDHGKDMTMGMIKDRTSWKDGLNASQVAFYENLSLAATRCRGSGRHHWNL